MKYGIITGASGGIGKVLTEKFRANGYQIIEIDKVKREFSTDYFIECDLNHFAVNSDYRQSIISKINYLKKENKIEVLVNNAAIQILNNLKSFTTEEINLTINVNLIAPFLLIQAFADDLTQSNGSVINISSIHEMLTKPEFIWYSTSKAALSGMTRALAVDSGSQFRINAICPAAIRTPMLEAGFLGKEQQLQELASMHPSNCIGEPEEIAELSLFLASPKAKFINGSTLGINGGIAARLHDPI